MLDWYYMNGVERYIDNENFVVWKFNASKDAYEKQARPLIYSYSLMTRAYGTYFNEDNFISYFTKEGFDVYLVDWGKDSLFTLPGWSMDDIADVMEKQVMRPLLKQYKVEKLNLFCVCIGGAILSFMLNKKPHLSDLVHRMSYYGVPILGHRDLGMEKSFNKLYHAMAPWQHLWFVKNSGFSLFFLDSLIMQSGSLSMLQWSWEEFFKERKGNSFMNTIYWTFDDRWVPVPALMGIMEQAFVDHKEQDTKKSFRHFHPRMNTAEIHFLNIVGQNDMLVKPSASIVDYESTFPDRFKTFEQMILDTGHFMFSEPGFTDVKEQISRWFAGYGLNDLCYKISNNMGQKFLDRAEEVIATSFTNFFNYAKEDVKQLIITQLNALLSNKTLVDNRDQLNKQLASEIKTNKTPEFFATLLKEISPALTQSDRR
jgi:hypothetical protein